MVSLVITTMFYFMYYIMILPLYNEGLNTINNIVFFSVNAEGSALVTEYLGLFVKGLSLDHIFVK